MSRKILLSTGALAIVALISKGIGFIKQATVAAYFGAGIDTDIYFLAAGIVANLLFAIDVALRTVVLPMYNDKKENEGSNEASKLISNFLIFFAVVAIAIATLVIFIAPLIAKLIAFTYDNASLLTLSYYIRVISISLVFSVIITIFAAVLNANRQYVFPRVASILQSLVAILSIIFLYRWLGILSLVFSIPAAYFLQSLIMCLFAYKRTPLELFWQRSGKDTKIALKRMLPVLIGSATVQINQIVDKMISSSLETGSVSALSYSGTLYDFVGTVFIASATTVFFTELSSTAAINNMDGHKFLLRRGISFLSLLLVPITVITVMFSIDIVTIVFQRGAFGSSATALTSIALAGYSIGFLFYGVRELLARSFYSMGDTKTPMINSIIAVTVNIIFSIVLSHFIGVGGVALATSIAAIQSVFFLGFKLTKMLKGLGIKSLLPTLTKVVASAAVMAAVLFLLGTLPHTENIHSLFRFISAAGIGFTVYIIMLKILKCRELVEFEMIVYNKIFKPRG